MTTHSLFRHVKDNSKYHEDHEKRIELEIARNNW